MPLTGCIQMHPPSPCGGLPTPALTCASGGGGGGLGSHPLRMTASSVPTASDASHTSLWVQGRTESHPHLRVQQRPKVLLVMVVMVVVVGGRHRMVVMVVLRLEVVRVWLLLLLLERLLVLVGVVVGVVVVVVVVRRLLHQLCEVVHQRLARWHHPQ